MPWFCLFLVILFESVWVNVGREFEYLGYEEIVNTLNDLESSYPGLIEVYTANEMFGIGTYGECGDGVDCEIYVVRVTNEYTLDDDPSRPEVYFSGEIHGDERVGPTACVEFIRLLLSQYNENEWLQHLVDTRSIWLTPMTNAHGYYAGVRNEGSVDVNRDFPIDKPSGCMKSLAARAINELYKSHLFQVAVTFHSGLESISYVWGTVSNNIIFKHNSPDKTGLDMIGSTMSAYAGPNLSNEMYPHGPINEIVYPVRGGLEDWSYATSWDKTQDTSSCNSHSGYPSSRTRYKKKQLRTLTYLVETSPSKTPSEASLGSDRNVLDPQGNGQGHIPRNIRLMLFLTDIVQPYVKVIDPESACRQLLVEWEIGGSLFVDETYIRYAYWKNSRRRRVVKRKTEIQSNGTRWAGTDFEGHVNGHDITLNQEHLNRKAHPFSAAFSAELSLPPGAELKSIQVFAVVDSKWKENSAVYPNVGPQSHLVRARTRNRYRISLDNSHQIRGGKIWKSEKIKC